jgi:hypothetical protein
MRRARCQIKKPHSSVPPFFIALLSLSPASSPSFLLPLAPTRRENGEIKKRKRNQIEKEEMNGVEGEEKCGGGSGHDGEASAAVSLEALRKRMADFARERDWEQFHSPRNLLLAMVCLLHLLSFLLPRGLAG